LIFIFTGESGETYGYRDEFRPDGTFWYTGEGQTGMFVRNVHIDSKKHLSLDYARCARTDIFSVLLKGGIA
jgi:hypothetical protein